MADIEKLEPKKKPVVKKDSGNLSVGFGITDGLDIYFTDTEGELTVERMDSIGENEGKNIEKWPDTQD